MNTFKGLAASNVVNGLQNAGPAIKGYQGAFNRLEFTRCNQHQFLGGPNYPFEIGAQMATTKVRRFTPLANDDQSGFFFEFTNGFHHLTMTQSGSHVIDSGCLKTGLRTIKNRPPALLRKPRFLAIKLGEFFK